MSRLYACASTIDRRWVGKGCIIFAPTGTGKTRLVKELDSRFILDGDELVKAHIGWPEGRWYDDEELRQAFNARVKDLFQRIIDTQGLVILTGMMDVGEIFAYLPPPEDHWRRFNSRQPSKLTAADFHLAREHASRMPHSHYLGTAIIIGLFIKNCEGVSVSGKSIHFRIINLNSDNYAMVYPYCLMYFLGWSAFYKSERVTAVSCYQIQNVIQIGGPSMMVPTINYIGHVDMKRFVWAPFLAGKSLVEAATVIEAWPELFCHISQSTMTHVTSMVKSLTRELSDEVIEQLRQSHPKGSLILLTVENPSHTVATKLITNPPDTDIATVQERVTEGYFTADCCIQPPVEAIPVVIESSTSQKRKRKA